MAPVRLLLFGDTHLGFDLPVRPRGARRHRGEDFFANTALVLEQARALAVDAVVHGGDVFFRSRVPPAIADRAYGLFWEHCERGPPLFVIPGNHERSRLPPSLWLHHPRLFVFDRPRVFRFQARGQEVALAGLPFLRTIRADFPAIAARLCAEAAGADHRVLCMHQAVEGATVGPQNFTFRDAPDVVRARDLGCGFDAILSGHIHRRQVLWPRAVPGVPVAYAGSVERTAFAERDEPKGFFVVTLPRAGPLSPACFRFHRLPSRPMYDVSLAGPWRDSVAARRALAAALDGVPHDAVVRVHVRPPSALSQLTAADVRAVSPPNMLVDVVWPRERAAAPYSEPPALVRSTHTAAHM